MVVAEGMHADLMSLSGRRPGVAGRQAGCELAIITRAAAEAESMRRNGQTQKASVLCWGLGDPVQRQDACQISAERDTWSAETTASNPFPSSPPPQALSVA